MSPLNNKLIAIDDGHGMGTSGKRTPLFPNGIKSPDTGKNFMHENEFNRAVAKYLDIELKRCGFRTIMVAPTDADTPLSTRCKIANDAKADLYVSIHANANTGKWGTWGGAETYTYGKGESDRVGRIIHKHIMKGTPMRDRGVKNGDWLYVVKNTTMPSVLVEAGFMDNLDEAKLLLSDAFRRETAREIAMGICESYGVKYVAEEVSKPQQSPSTWYRVRLHWSDAKTQKGAFQDLPNAKELADSLKNEGDYRVFDEKGTVIYDPTPEKEDNVWYRVRKTWEDAKGQVGAFHDLNGAKERADLHAKEGYKVFDDNGKVLYEPKIVIENQYYRVRLDWSKPETQIGAFKELEGAKSLADERASEGFKVFDDNGKVVYTPKVEVKPEPTPQHKPTPKPTPKPEPVDPHKGHHDIIGSSVVSPDKLVAFARTINPDAKDIEEIAKSFIEVGNIYGVRGDVAFCQSLIETGWFKFDGGTAVTPDQHNYCGMGVVRKGIKGNSFETVRDGVTAQIQHLFAYATKLPMPEERILSPRLKYVTRGIAPHWEDLNMRWAMNDKYGQHIISLYNKLLDYKYVPPVVEQPKPEPIQPPVEPIETPIEEPKPIEVPIEIPVEQPVEEPIIEEPKPQEPIVEEEPINKEEEKLNFIKRVIDYILEKLFQLLKGGKK